MSGMVSIIEHIESERAQVADVIDGLLIKIEALKIELTRFDALLAVARPQAEMPERRVLHGQTNSDETMQGSQGLPQGTSRVTLDMAQLGDGHEPDDTGARRWPMTQREAILHVMADGKEWSKPQIANMCAAEGVKIPEASLTSMLSKLCKTNDLRWVREGVYVRTNVEQVSKNGHVAAVATQGS